MRRRNDGWPGLPGGVNLFTVGGHTGFAFEQRRKHPPGSAMTITLVGSDLNLLRQIYACTILDRNDFSLPEEKKAKLLTLDLIDEEDGRVQVTPKGHEELKRHRAE
jgi:hypothetical protein